MLNCPYCQATSINKRGLHAPTGEQIYSCKACGRKFRATTVPKPASTFRIIACLNCGKQTSNPKFCSSSCAATYTNKAQPKRKAKPRFCKYCGQPLAGKRQVSCENCNPNVVNWMERTLGDIQRAPQYQVSAHLRTIARNLYNKANLPHVCANCGYSKHVEICHIKPINSFSEETSVAVINALENLVALCPNCHWELDHGLLKL